MTRGVRSSLQRLVGRSPRARSGREPPHHAALRRLSLSGLYAIVVLALVAGLGGSWSVAVSLAWNAAAIGFLVSVWQALLRKDATATKNAALSEDDSRTAADAVLVWASMASLVAVAFVLVDAAHRSGYAKAEYIALAVVSVVAAWLAVHTVYTLRYAHLYYAEPVGGVSFHSDDPPDYIDFVYMALTIGMTFQVSDTDLSARAIRRTAIRHALISYVFGAVIVAIMINIVGSLAT